MTTPKHPICPHCKRRIQPQLTEEQRERARQRAAAAYARKLAKAQQKP